MKNMIIAGFVGMLFMAGGFWYGLRLKPLPTPQSKEAAAAAEQTAAAFIPAPDAITVDTLKKASEAMMNLNDALKAREEKVAAREQALQQRETELRAERTAVDASHEKFKELYNEFQSRLQLVEANQLDELQKEAALYGSMGSDKSIELIKAMDDPAMTRLFSVMETKPLAKLIADWKTKYPSDIPRLLHALDGMAQVMPKEKIALNDNGPGANATSPPPQDQPSANPPADSTTPAPAPDSSSTPPAPDTSAPAPAPTPASAADASATATPNSTADSPTPPPLSPPSDSNPAPISTATSN